MNRARSLDALRRLMFVLITLVAASPSQAQEELKLQFANVTNDKVHLHARFNAEEGSVDVAFYMASTYGGGGDGHAGFCKSDARGTFRVGDSQFTIKGDDNYVNKRSALKLTNMSNMVQGDLIEYRNVKRGTELSLDQPGDADTKKDEFKWVIIYRKKLKPSDLGTDMTISVNGTAWHRAPGTDKKVSVSGTIHIPDEAAIRKRLTIDDFKLANPRINITFDGNLRFRFDMLMGNSANPIGDKEDLHIVKKNGNWIACARTVNEHNYVYEFDVKQDTALLNNLDEVSLQRIYTPHDGQGENALHYNVPLVGIPFNAYPLPQEAKASYSANTRELKAEWKLERAPEKKQTEGQDANGLEDIMLTKILRDGVVVDSAEQAYTAQQLNYSHTYTLDEGIDSAHYVVRISRLFRSGNRQWECGIKNIPITASSRHYYVLRPQARLSDNNEYAIVTWTLHGGVWSANSKCTLVRLDKTSGQEKEIDLSQDVLLDKQSFADYDVLNSHEYTYRIRIAPGGSYAQTESQQSEAVVPFSKGTMFSMQASQGEFAEKVSLNWNARNYDYYSIIRQRMDDPTDRPTQVALIENTGNSTTYTYVDELTLPGIIYTYSIYGVIAKKDGSILQRDSLSDFGFRKTAGDINGRLTFEDGSAVQQADVRLTPYDEVKRYALSFQGKGDQQAVLGSDSVMTGAREFTLQALVCPTTGQGQIINKQGVFALGLYDGLVSLSRGQATISTEQTLTPGIWTQLTYVATADSILLYVDGKPAFGALLDSLSAPSDFEPSVAKEAITLGSDSYGGSLTEVRLWSRALSAAEVEHNHNRYLIGNESGLEAYYNFTFPCEGRFFDSSYKGTLYNRRHGSYSGTAVGLDSDNVPSDDALSYLGTTDANGVYTVRNVLFYGNGTSYMVTPLLSGHTFSPTSEVRFFSNTSASHSINFTDKSSFQVPVSITYSGTDYPVEGVRFEIDGNTVTKDNKVVYTDQDGSITLNVPIGVHKVRAIKEGHTLSQDGYLVDIEGNHLNYQADMAVRHLADSTRVLYVGRIAGGKTEGGKAIGFGLSHNNLSRNSTLTLTPLKTHSLNNGGTVHALPANTRPATADKRR